MEEAQVHGTTRRRGLRRPDRHHDQSQLPRMMGKTPRRATKRQRRTRGEGFQYPLKIPLSVPRWSVFGPAESRVLRAECCLQLNDHHAASEALTLSLLLKYSHAPYGE